MKKIEDKNTRYFMDVDLKEQKILGWDYEQREVLIQEKVKNPFIHRIFLTKGQFNKLNKKLDVVQDLLEERVL